jgi:hypothetical protein
LKTRREQCRAHHEDGDEPSREIMKLKASRDKFLNGWAAPGIVLKHETAKKMCVYDIMKKL